MMMNPLFDKILYKFNFFLIDSKNDNDNLLLDLKTDDNFIIIDDSLPKSNYFIICVDYNLIIVEQSNSLFLQNLFEKLQNSIIYCLKNKDIIQKKFPTINFNFSNNDQGHFLRFEIPNFCNEVKMKSKVFQEFWKMIQRSISGFLIKKSYKKITSKRRLYDNIEKVQSDSNRQFKREELIRLRELGSSTTAVILYYYIEKEQLIAMKIGTNDESLIKREQNNYLKCEHLFLLRYYGYIVKNDVKSILIEFISGNTLNKIQSIQLNSKEKIEIIFELILIVKYFHKHGLIYRDLRPENVMIDHNKTAVLIDLDRLIENSDGYSIYTTKSFFHEYIAPEIIKNETYSYPADIYSLGLTIYFIVTEKNPNIESRNVTELMNEFTNEFIYLKDIFENSIQTNQDKRPTIDEIYNKFEQKYILNNEVNYEIRKSLINIYDINFLYENKENDNLSELYLQLGRKHEKNFPYESTKYFEISAKQNNLKAQEILTDFLLKSKEESKKYEEYLIKLKNPQKLNLYATKFLIQSKFEKAIKFFEAASSLNYLIAQLNLGRIFFHQSEVKDINKSIFYFKLAADQNSPEAQFYLGLIYYEKVFDFNKSMYYFKLSSDQNEPRLQFYLGLIYSENKIVQKDLNKSIYYFELSAKNNNVKAQFYLGNFYYVNKKIDKAFYYFKLAANQNDLESLYYLGLICLSTKSNYYNIKESINYFTISANQNHVNSQYCLGVIYSSNDIKYYDINKALYYFQLAANNYHIKSFFRLGIIYYLGIQIKKDLKKAFHFFSIAANQNCSNSQFFLGLIYYESNNINQAIKYFTLSADQNHSQSQFRLGMIYYEINHEKCIYYLTKSAQNNSLFAQYNLGMIYYEGLITIRDINKSIYYLKLASKQNHSLATFYLGIIYSNGKYIKENINKTIKYYTMSANQNNSYAQLGLEILYLQGIKVKKDINKAICYLKLSSKQNNSYSQLILGTIYLFNEGYNQDIGKSVYYLKLSAEKNNSYAFLYLGLVYYNHYHNYNKAIEYFSLACRDKSNYTAHYMIGCLYFECNNNTNRDIKKAIYYFKEASSFNSNYAKNNLGIIYKHGDGVDRNINWSIEYFNEAIKIDDDHVSFYNLAHLYFYEEFVLFDLDKAVFLLIKSAAKNNYYTIHLLSLALVLKCENISLVDIKNEINKVDQNSSESLSMNVFEVILFKNLTDKTSYNLLYDELKNVDLIYNLNRDYIEYKINEKTINKTIFQRNIEGFVNDLYSFNSTP